MNQKTVCKPQMCTGCMACVELCPRMAVSVVDSLEAFNSVIDTKECISCGACFRVCQQNNETPFAKTRSWSQGWTDDTQRARSSSGGIASEIAKSFVRSGGLVCACYQDGERFRFRLFSDEQQLGIIAGSKYVKSDASGSYKEVKRALSQGHRVLFIGLPCQVSAMKAYVGLQFEDYLYTIDIICHGAPSARLLWGSIDESQRVAGRKEGLSFRSKGSWTFGLSVGEKRLQPIGVLDAYTAAFLRGYSYPRSCYSCKYARLERVGDLTLGDSWDSGLPKAEQEKGISLVLCQTERGRELLDSVPIKLHEVDTNRAIAANAQLSHPSNMPRNRWLFFALLDRGFSPAVSLFICMPLSRAKQALKSFLIRLHLYGV